MVNEKPFNFPLAFTIYFSYKTASNTMELKPCQCILRLRLYRLDETKTRVIVEYHMQ